MLLDDDTMISQAEATIVGDLQSRLHCHVVIWKNKTPWNDNFASWEMEEILRVVLTLKCNGPCGGVLA